MKKPEMTEDETLVALTNIMGALYEIGYLKLASAVNKEIDQLIGVK